MGLYDIGEFKGGIDVQYLLWFVLLEVVFGSSTVGLVNTKVIAPLAFNAYF